MTTEILVNIGSGNGSLPDGTEPLPEPKLTNHQLGPVAFIWGQFHRKWSRYLSLMWIWKITNLELQPHLSGANELRNTSWFLPVDDIIGMQIIHSFQDLFGIMKKHLLLECSETCQVVGNGSPRNKLHEDGYSAVLQACTQVSVKGLVKIHEIKSEKIFQKCIRLCWASSFWWGYLISFYWVHAIHIHIWLPWCWCKHMTERHGQNFRDKYFLEWKFEFCLKFLPKDLIDKKSSLVQVMAWCGHRSGSILTNIHNAICHTHQWANKLSNADISHSTQINFFFNSRAL